eukprot:jgi/Ulvmu1/1828/UM119_0046.1
MQHGVLCWSVKLGASRENALCAGGYGASVIASVHAAKLCMATLASGGHASTPVRCSLMNGTYYTESSQGAPSAVASGLAAVAAAGVTMASLASLCKHDGVCSWVHPGVWMPAILWRARARGDSARPGTTAVTHLMTTNATVFSSFDCCLVILRTVYGTQNANRMERSLATAADLRTTTEHGETRSSRYKNGLHLQACASSSGKGAFCDKLTGRLVSSALLLAAQLTLRKGQVCDA